MTYKDSLDVLGAESTLHTVPTWILHLTLKPCQKIKNHKLPEVNLQREREEINHIGKLERM